MLGMTLTEKLALTATLLALSALSCRVEHRVSPWGALRSPPLFAYVMGPDLSAQLAAVDAETAELGLTLAVELKGSLARGGGPVVARGYRGTDALGRPTSAVRVATPRGVVMALGPLEAGSLDRSQATELVPSLLPGVAPTGMDGDPDQLGAFRSATDLNGDGSPDVVLRNEAGALEIWAVQAVGASPYTVELTAPPGLGMDMDGDGRLDLASRLRLDPADPIKPELLDVATVEGGRYTNRSDAARAFHAARAVEPRPAAAAADKPPTDVVRLRRAIERAWHAILSGEPGKKALDALDRQPVPAELDAAFAAHTTRLARAAALRAKPPSGAPTPRAPAKTLRIGQR
jgi:hypothetical protein